MNINFISKLKNALMTLVFLAAISSNCFAGGDDVVPYQDIFKIVKIGRQTELRFDSCDSVNKQNKIKFSQCILASELEKDKAKCTASEHKCKYKYLYEHFTRNKAINGSVGLCEALSDYVEFRQLLNERSADQLLSTEIVLHDLETILRIVQKNTGKIQILDGSRIETEIAAKLAYHIQEAYYTLASGQIQLAKEILRKFDEAKKDLWKTRQKSDTVSVNILIIGQYIDSPFNVFNAEQMLAFILQDENDDKFIINKQIFMDGMNAIEVGAYINFVVVSDSLGHKMLIAKNGDNNFAFFDPNFGITFNLTLEELYKKTNCYYQFYKDNYGLNRVSFFNKSKAIKGIQNRFNFDYPVIPYFLSSSYFL